MFVATHRGRSTPPRGTAFNRAGDLRCGGALETEISNLQRC
jgi:hypothetical protein